MSPNEFKPNEQQWLMWEVNCCQAARPFATGPTWNIYVPKGGFSLWTGIF